MSRLSREVGESLFEEGIHRVDHDRHESPDPRVSLCRRA